MKITNKQLIKLLDICSKTAISMTHLSEEYKKFIRKFINEIVDQQSDEIREIE